MCTVGNIQPFSFKQGTSYSSIVCIKSADTGLSVNMTGIGRALRFWSLEGSGTITIDGKLKDYSVEFQQDDLNDVKNFVLNNSYALECLFLNYISVSEFLKVLIKGGSRACQREIQLQKEAVDRIVFGD